MTRDRQRDGRAQCSWNRVQLDATKQEKRERDGIAHISREFARYGLTTVHHEGSDLAAIQDVRARGDLRHRVNYEANGRMLDAMIANGIRSGFGDDWIRFGATAEHTVDGSFSERTMAMSTPCAGSTYKGNIKVPRADVRLWWRNGILGIKRYGGGRPGAINMLQPCRGYLRMVESSAGQPAAMIQDLFNTRPRIHGI